MSTLTDYDSIANKNIMPGMSIAPEQCFVDGSRLFAGNPSLPCTSYGSGQFSASFEHATRFSVEDKYCTAHSLYSLAFNDNNNSGITHADNISNISEEYLVDDDEDSSILSNLPHSCHDFELKEMHIRLERNQSSPLIGGHSSPALSSRVSSNCPSVEPPSDPAEPEDLEVQLINESFEEQQRQSQMYQSGDLKTIFYQGSSEPESSKTRSDTEKSGRSSVERPERLPYAKKLSAQDSKSSAVISQCQHTTPTQLLNPNQNFEPLLTPKSEALIQQRIYTREKGPISKRRVSEPLARKPQICWKTDSHSDLSDSQNSSDVLDFARNRGSRGETVRCCASFDQDPSYYIRCDLETPGRLCSEDDTEALAKGVIESLFSGIVQTPLLSDFADEDQTNTAKMRPRNPDVFRKLDMDAACTSLSEPMPSESEKIQCEGPVVVREDEDEGDSWENLDDDKLEKQMSEMKLEAATKSVKRTIDCHAPPTDILQPWDPLCLPHVLEAYDIPEYKLCEDVIAALATIGFGSASVRWIERKIVFVVFEGERQARDVLVLYKHDWLRLRPLSKSSIRVQNVAKEKQFNLMPTRVRPKTNAGVARRMVENTLGLRSSATREQRMAERRQIAEARAAKKSAVQWDD